MEPVEIVTLILRIWIGSVMLAHGVNHAKSLHGTARWFGSKGFRHAPFQARLSAFGEIATGAALVVGLLTSVAVAGVLAIMTVAFWSIHRFAGFFVFRRPDEGWEYVATMTPAATLVAVIGPGPVSIDDLAGVRLDGWTGLALAVAGVVVGAIYLALFWRRPGRT